MFTEVVLAMSEMARQSWKKAFVYVYTAVTRMPSNTVRALYLYNGQVCGKVS